MSIHVLFVVIIWIAPIDINWQYYWQN